MCIMYIYIFCLIPLQLFMNFMSFTNCFFKSNTIDPTHLKICTKSNGKYGFLKMIKSIHKLVEFFDNKYPPSTIFDNLFLAATPGCIDNHPVNKRRYNKIQAIDA